MPATCAKVLGILLCLPLAARGQAPPACTAPTVETLAGPVCGKMSDVPPGDGTLSASAYLGLRYAQPPVRWQNPQPLSSSWTTPFPATEFGSICPQPTPKPPKPDQCPQPTPKPISCPRPIPSQSEDCLFLNAWVPSGTPAGAKLPVMVFIHGGAFFEGSGSAPLFDGTYLAASGKVIVVTFNYRLGSLGFLALKGISTSTNNNFGFRDQILALGWVKDNIAGFGGDPANVTIFGESAGAMSVGLHALVSPQSSGLFKAAMMESNPLGVPYKTLKDASKLGATFSDLLDCGWFWQNHAKCLRGKSPEDLVKAEVSGWLSLGGLQNLMAWAPAIDGKLVTGQPLAAAAAGKLSVPMVLGTNKDEGTLFMPACLSRLGYDLLLPAIVGKSHAAQVRRTAPYICSKDDCAAQMTQVATDYLFTCPNRYLAVHAAAAAGAKPVYVYDFTQVSNFNFWPTVPRCAGKVCHGDELPYVFHTPQGVCPAYAFTPPEDTLSRTMVSYWASFGARQDPNGGSLFTWSPFSPDKAYLILNEHLETADDPLAKAANCELWDSIGYETAAKGKLTSP